MDRDYYLILGVSPTADLIEVKKAYRRKVLECHPDRGGTHESMVLVNEAWEVLSDPDTRKRYDQARANREDQRAQASSAADSTRAQQKAQEYPRKWVDMEKWLNSVAGDFVDVKYGTKAGWFGTTLPTAEESWSGWLFVGVGGLLGVLLFIALIAILADSVPPKTGSGSTSSSGFWRIGLIGGGKVVLFLLALSFTGGAWLGQVVHRVLRATVKGFQDDFKQQKPENAAESSSNNGNSGTSTPPATRVVVCTRCSQKLRIPNENAVIIVTCGKCGLKFDCGPVTPS